MYVTNSASNDISVIDIGTDIVIDTIPVGKGPVDLAFNPYNGNMYVDNSISNNTSVIDTRTNTVIDTIPTRGVSPLGIAFNRYDGDKYVTNFVSNTVSVIAPITTRFYSGCNGITDETVTFQLDAWNYPCD